MNDQIDEPTMMIPEEPKQLVEWPLSDEARLAILSHFGAPYCEGETPLFI